MQIVEQAPLHTPPAPRGGGINVKAIATLAFRYSLFIILGIFIVVLAISNGHFLTISNLNVILIQVAANALLAIGVTFVILTGGIDLSVGSIVGLSGVVAALIAQNDGLGSCVEGIAAGVAAGAAIGLFNGVLVAYARVPAFVASLGNMTVATGIAYVISNGQPISGLSDQFMYLAGNIGNFSVPVIVMVLTVIVAWFVLSRTRFGMHVYAVGGNAYASRVAGINVPVVKLAVYVISGLLAGLAGVILAARATAGMANTGVGYELNAIAAAVIGGISLMGGRGTIVGTVLGFLMIGVIDNGLNIINVSPFYQEIIKGLIIIGAVFVDNVTHASDDGK